MYLIYDTETSGLAKNYKAPLTDFENWPRIVQLAWQLHDPFGKLLEQKSVIIKPDDWEIPEAAKMVHGISNERAQKEGFPIKDVLAEFSQVVSKSVRIIGHNIDFDQNTTGCEFLRLGGENPLSEIKTIDTMLLSTDFCAIPSKRGYKWPKLDELYLKLFDSQLIDAHDAAYDVEATAKCFFELIQKEIIQPISPDTTQNIDKKAIHYEKPILEKSNFSVEENSEHIEKQDADKHQVNQDIQKDESNNKKSISVDGFANLFVHSEYSILHSVNRIPLLIKKAKENKIKTLAITDSGNLHGAFTLVSLCKKANIKPIVGCELYWAENRIRANFKEGEKDVRYSQIYLAKNKEGYQNLSILSSLGNIEGFYYVPRVDKALIEEHQEGLIVLSGNMKSEIPSVIYNKGEKAGEEAFCYWHNLFKDDFYAQINRNGVEGEDKVNKVIHSFAKKYNVKIIATCESYYLNKADAKINDILQCIRIGEKVSTPIGLGRRERKGLKNETYYYRTPQEISEEFYDIPEAVENIKELCNKVENYELTRKVELPTFSLPESFENQDNYLRHLTYEGAKERYEILTDEIRDRIDFELATIKKTGYPGYFLIVQDFIAQAREMGVSVGPGRGSAAGSVVAYCTKITNIDPLKYNLLFERFLNPERVSLPDIDVDFDDNEREKVINYVIQKYGQEQVAQIITFGKLKAKNAIKDCARVLDLPFADSNKMSNLVQDKVTDLKEAIKISSELSNLKNEDSIKGNILRNAIDIEGNIRNTGIHACGVIIAPEPIKNIIPVTTSKKTELQITQFDNDVVEHVGLLKMDFLGLKTLTIINSCLNNIKLSTGKMIDIDKIPLDNSASYEIFQKGETSGIFQFESTGMQSYLSQLHPDKFEDLIAMVALYRPGPMQYIPNFINRKHGTEKVSYDLPKMEDILKETYGVTVYQEQVMLLSQVLADFSKGEADVLRKAMGKKQKSVLNDLSEKFKKGCEKKGITQKIIDKIWKDWEAFAAYAFNKSHATCYALIAYQTAYLKANYPYEFMSALLSHKLSNKDKLSGFIEECNHLDIKIFPPNVNTSFYDFHINNDNNIKGIHFGFGAIKGFGEKLASILIEEREKKGKFNSIINFTERVGKRIQKSTFLLLAQVGAFDTIDSYHRNQYLFSPNNDDNCYIDSLIKYAENFYKSQNTNQLGLFDSSSAEKERLAPKPLECEPFTNQEIAKLEKKIIGTYLNNHPLDEIKIEYSLIVNTTIAEFKKINDGNNQNKTQRPINAITLGGIVTDAKENISRQGKPWGTFILEDFSSSTEIRLFGNDYVKYKNFLTKGYIIFISCSFQPKYNNPKEVYLKINKVNLFNDVLKHKNKYLQLSISTAFTDNHNLSKKLLDTLLNQKGKFPIYFNIIDYDIKTKVNGISKNMHINLNSELLKSLESIKKESNIKANCFDYTVQLSE